MTEKLFSVIWLLVIANCVLQAYLIWCEIFTRHKFSQSNPNSWKIIPANIYSVCIHTYVAVLGRNRTFFHCVFRSHYRIRRAVTQYFRYGRGSYALCKLMNTWHVCTARMCPTPNGSSALQRFTRRNALEIRNGIMFDFYLGLPHIDDTKIYWLITQGS